MSHSRHFPSDLVCFSHLRWNFVFQRPQHLLSRAAKDFQRVFFFEEPVYLSINAPRLDVRVSKESIYVVQPQLPDGTSHEEAVLAEKIFIDELIADYAIEDFVGWYYTPMALSFSRHINSTVIVYDCMDELSLFKQAPKELLENEKTLLNIADLVFTGGQSLYEAKRDRHPNVIAFPSSIDVPHFAAARTMVSNTEPSDQATIAYPRLGYCGVIDERIDFDLIAGMAKARPDWQIVMIGPTAKVDPAALPRASNIHYLGQKDYSVLPQYLARWDVAMMPFAINDATKFISPTKTPEYLAAGKPVVSTAIRDVVRPYGELGLVSIASTLDEFLRAAASNGMDEGALPIDWLKNVDAFLEKNSWDKTWKNMSDLMKKKWKAKQSVAQEVDFLIVNSGEEFDISPEVA